MVTEIPKGTPEKKIRSILRKNRKKANKASVNSFFGKLPGIEDGLKFQEKVRDEWE
jgi:3-deoxy-D-manno-octulosonic acid (KDO) 8-phosphate synthase